MFVTGLKYPILAASVGGAWFIGRIVYTFNYRAGAEKVRVKMKFECTWFLSFKKEKCSPRQFGVIIFL
jgi:hypothetical protein